MSGLCLQHGCNLNPKSPKSGAALTIIREAASRPQMHFVPVKSIEQQSMLCVPRLREGFKADRVACIH